MNILRMITIVLSLALILMFFLIPEESLELNLVYKGF